TAVDPEDVTAGGTGFLVIAALVVATVFLLRSLNRQLKKVDFEEEPLDDADRPGATPPAGGPDGGADAAGGDSAPDGPAAGEAAGPDDESDAGPRSPAS